MEEYLSRINFRDGKGTWSLLLLMTLVYLCTCFEPQGFQEGCFFNERILSGEWWRILTPSLLHVSLVHLIKSACWLVFLGYQFEYFFGTLRFLIVFFLLSVFSNCCQYYFQM